MDQVRKSTVDEIRQRFDADVERFSNLETGQSATVDAPLALELIAEACAAVNPDATRLLDVGCGAGNYSLKLLQKIPSLQVTLIDLSRPMLDRAQARLQQSTATAVEAIQGDIREILLQDGSYDVVVAAAVLHHLRTDDEWRLVFQKLFRSLAPGGSLWIFDLVESDIPQVQSLLWQRYGDYLTSLKDEAYKDDVFAYIEHEDTPRSLGYQLALMTEVGFERVEVLHKHLCFAAFGGVKTRKQTG